MMTIVAEQAVGVWLFRRHATMGAGAHGNRSADLQITKTKSLTTGMEGALKIT
jgi:hypothetical protein